MAPELREIYVQGEFGERPEYNPWKADVYSTGMSLLDCGLLTIGEKKPKKEKLDTFQENYGKEFREFLELCLCEEPEKRPDFEELVKSPQFLALQQEENKEKMVFFAKLFEFIEVFMDFQRKSRFFQAKRASRALLLQNSWNLSNL